MARLTRKELKSDSFALEVGQTLTFFEEHRQEIIRYGAAALGLVVLVAGYFWYSSRQHAKRQEALYRAIQIQEMGVGPIQPGAVQRTFPTQQVKDETALRAFTEVQSSYPNSAEGQIASYYIGCIRADQGKMAEAEKIFKDVADKADERYASLAKIALSQIYFGDGRNDQGEAILRGLMEHPTPFVSQAQAAILLARELSTRKPAEARKLLEPLRSVPGAIGSAAISAYAELPQQ